MGAPTGTVTFLFTDIEGSTRLWESAPEAMRRALARHDELLRHAIGEHGGLVFSTGGDGLAAAFARAEEAVRAAVGAQARLSGEPWPDGAPIRVRMGLHSGTAEERDGDYFGPVVNRTARLMAVAHGGQVLCSQATATLTGAGAGVELRPLGEHRLRDLGAAEVVFQVGAGAFPPLRSVDTVPTNLPTVRTELVGRSEELRGLAALVERERLVTLTGVGGVGKTRLALGLAGRLAPGYADGCWLVELAPVADGSEVPKTFASVIGAPATDADALARYLADRRLLVVVDNCEHVLGDVAELVDTLLAAAPDLHLVVTSREPLGIDGEHVRRVQSLAVPAGDAGAVVAAQSAAVRLFAERASAVAEGFALTDANTRAVTEICRHLDGIPLAIELAAARVRAMPPAEIAARLGERFRLLAGGSRRAQERHRTLAATVGWSYDLLSGEERVVFRRLSVLPASFDLAAAEAVAGEGGLDVVGHIVRLVDRSLVQYEPETDRYRLLETLRQYGAERLADAAETDATRARHAAHFLGMVARVAPEVRDARYPGASLVLSRELDNLRAVADWCIERGDWDVLLGLCHDLWIFLFLAAPVDMAAWYGQVTAHSDELDEQRLIDAMGRFAYLSVTSLGDIDTARLLAERAVSTADERALAQSPHAFLAAVMVLQYTTRDESGLGLSERALAAAEARGDEVAAMAAVGMIGMWLADRGDREQAMRYGLEEIRRAEASGQPGLILTAVVTVASYYLWAGYQPDFGSAYEFFTHYRVGDYHDNAGATLWYDIGWGATLVGLKDARAVRPLADVVRLADRHGAPHALDVALRLLAIALVESGRCSEAMLLATYSDENLRGYRFDTPAHAWVQTALDRALEDVPDRTAKEEAASGASRHQIMALINELDAPHQVP